MDNEPSDLFNRVSTNYSMFQIHAWMTEDPTINRIQDVVLCRDASSLACSSSAQLKWDLLRSDLSETRVIRDQAPVKFILSDLWPNTMVTLGILVVSQTHKGDLSDTIEFMTMDAPPTTALHTVKFHSSRIDKNVGSCFRNCIVNGCGFTTKQR